MTAVRNYTFKDVTLKENLFQKLFKKENVKEYEIRVVNGEEDVAEAFWTYSFALDLRQLMDESGLGVDWPKMLPVQDDMTYTDPMEEEDKEWFGSFPDPAWCHTKLQEAADVEEKAAVHSEEMLKAFRWLKDHWGNGYQIYANTGDLFDYYGDDELD
ncbi:hypothetical protein AU377_14470 [Sporosarcina sp. HYO08]|nr:hypothetical protein AU377_14470 [Sporosarcina sp. HYO08]